MTVEGLDHLHEIGGRLMRSPAESGRVIARMAGILFITATADIRLRPSQIKTA